MSKLVSINNKNLSLSMSQVTKIFNKTDSNQDGIITQKEIARQALRQHDLAQMGSREAKTAFSLLGTFLQGGSNGTGLKPRATGLVLPGEQYQPRKIELSMNDLQTMAKNDGNASQFTNADFKDAYGNGFNPTFKLDMDKLRQQAEMPAEKEVDKGCKKNSEKGTGITADNDISSILVLLMILFAFRR